ncbi:sugar nucleotide-binding protein, partial [Acinetobacter baumannii]
GELDRPYTEDDAPNPLGVYGRSKLDGERAIASVSGSWTIFRASWVISPQGSNFVNTMKRLASERDVVRVVDDQSGRPTLADDIATMCLDA